MVAWAGVARSVCSGMQWQSMHIWSYVAVLSIEHITAGLLHLRYLLSGHGANVWSRCTANGTREHVNMCLQGICKIMLVRTHYRLPCPPAGSGRPAPAPGAAGDQHPCGAACGADGTDQPDADCAAARPGAGGRCDARSRTAGSRGSSGSSSRGSSSSSSSSSRSSRGRSRGSSAGQLSSSDACAPAAAHHVLWPCSMAASSQGPHSATQPACGGWFRCL